MNLKIITAPSTEPLSISEAKDHLRILHNDENTLITALIKVARQQAESITQRALASATFEYVINEFPENEIVLPMPPVETVSSIKYKNSAGIETEWLPTSEYIFYNDEPAKIVPAYGKLFPSFTPYPIGAVKIRYIAGYKTTGNDASLIVPEDIKQALKLLIADYYEYREDLLARGHIPKTVPFGVNALLIPYRIWRF